VRLVNPLKTYRAGCSSKFRLEHSFVKERAIESRSKRRVESKGITCTFLPSHRKTWRKVDIQNLENNRMSTQEHWIISNTVM